MKYDGTDTIKVCVGNYGYYAEGELRDRWIELPQPEADIKRFLQDNGLQDAVHEEIYISDWDGMPFDLDSGCTHPFNEYTNLFELNMLAKQIQINPTGAQQVGAVFDCGQEVPDSIVGIMNWIEQSDELPYYLYDYSFAGNKDSWGNPVDAYMSPDEKLGWTVLEQNVELNRMLENNPCAMGAFDVEKYGHEFSYDLLLGPNGYVDATQEMPDEDFFELEEMREGINQQWDISRKPSTDTSLESKACGIAMPIPDQRTQANASPTLDGDARKAEASAKAIAVQAIEPKAKENVR